jgi:hypothetical protein
MLLGCQIAALSPSQTVMVVRIFYCLGLICRHTRNIAQGADACKRNCIDSETAKARAAVNQQGLQGGAPGNEAMQRALRDADVYQSELLKLGKASEALVGPWRRGGGIL